MTRPLNPRVPAPPSAEPVSPLPIGPRAALAAGAGVAIVAAVFAFGFRSAKPLSTVQVAASQYSVQMANYAFAPASITVNEGDTITWTNDDTAPHTVTTTSGPAQLNSPYLSKGQSWSYMFMVPGTYEYYCTVHPDMRAQVIVRAPAPATSAAVVPAHTQHAMSTAHAAAPAPAQAVASTPTGSAPSATAAAPAAAAPSASRSGSVPSAAPSQPQAQAQAQQAAATDGVTKLSPILLLGGLTAAIAVFCLLLVGSRPAPAQASSAAPESHRDDNDDYDY